MRKDKNVQIREQVDRLGYPTVEMLDREIARFDRKDSYRRLAANILTILSMAVAVIIVVTNMWIAVLQIDGTSMNPLLQMNEIVVAMRDSNPSENDIIAFYHDNTLHIKRVIALAGDTVNIDAEGHVSVNGKLLDEPYVTQPSLGPCDIALPFTVPSGTVFVMGDNRPVSKDSRESGFGVVGKNQIIGIVKFNVWPLTHFGSVS